MVNVCYIEEEEVKREKKEWKGFVSIFILADVGVWKDDYKKWQFLAPKKMVF